MLPDILDDIARLSLTLSGFGCLLYAAGNISKPRCWNAAILGVVLLVHSLTIGIARQLDRITDRLSVESIEQPLRASRHEYVDDNLQNVERDEQGSSKAGDYDT